MNEYEFLLEDRIAKIQSINEQYDLEHNAYLSFSGGLDSTILHFLIDMALPNNNIPRVYINTGVEYNLIVNYVKNYLNNDKRFNIIKPRVNIKKMLEKYGYPFKSKEHSLKIEQYKNGSRAKNILDYKNKKNFGCPKILQYQYSEDFKLHISNKCCYFLKKLPALKWQKENNKSIVLTGMRKEEGGQRINISCIVTDKDGSLKKFHPLLVVNKNWENWFIEKYHIDLCFVYYPPFCFDRTGCKCCPFSLDLQHQLDILKRYFPEEYKQCETLWEPVFTEYRRIGYRLRKQGEYVQTDIFEYL